LGFFLKIYHLATLQFSQDFRSETEILQKELGKKLTMDFVDIYLIFIGNGDTVPQIFGYRM
jgi:predicted ThiF/HesA family dinucleotide-utilizing enzyme